MIFGTWCCLKMSGSRCFNGIVIRSFVILLICDNSATDFRTPRLLYIGHKRYGNTLPTFAAVFNRQTAHGFISRDELFQQQFKAKLIENNHKKILRSKPHAWIIDNPVESALPRYINNMDQLKSILIQKLAQQNQMHPVVNTMPTTPQRLRQISNLEEIIKRLLNSNRGHVITNGPSIHSLEPGVHPYVPYISNNNNKSRLNAAHGNVKFDNIMNTHENHKIPVKLSNTEAKPVEIYPRVAKPETLPNETSVPSKIVRKKVRKIKRIKKKRPTSTKEGETITEKPFVSLPNLLAAPTENNSSDSAKNLDAAVTKTIENTNTQDNIQEFSLTTEVITSDIATEVTTMKLLSNSPTEIQNKPEENLTKTILPAETQNKKDTPADSLFENNITTENLNNANASRRIGERSSTENLNKIIPSTEIRSVDNSRTQLESPGLPIQKTVAENSSTQRALEDSSPSEKLNEKIKESLPANGVAEENSPLEKTVQGYSLVLRAGKTLPSENSSTQKVKESLSTEREAEQNLPTEKTVQLNSGTQKNEKSFPIGKALEESLPTQKAAEASLNSEKTEQDNMHTQEVTESLRVADESLPSLEAVPETTTTGTVITDSSPGAEILPLENAVEESMPTPESVPGTMPAESTVNDNSSVTWDAEEVYPVDKAVEESTPSEIPTEKTESPTKASTIRTLGRPLVFASD